MKAFVPAFAALFAVAAFANPAHAASFRESFTVSITIGENGLQQPQPQSAAAQAWNANAPQPYASASDAARQPLQAIPLQAGGWQAVQSSGSERIYRPLDNSADALALAAPLSAVKQATVTVMSNRESDEQIADLLNELQQRGVRVNLLVGDFDPAIRVAVSD